MVTSVAHGSLARGGFCLAQASKGCMTNPQTLDVSAAQVLEAHSDEVWHIAFSHTGDRLASASKDCSVAIWRVRAGGQAALAHSLRGHERSITYLAWSPDDTRMLTCGQKVVGHLGGGQTGSRVQGSGGSSVTVIC